MSTWVGILLKLSLNDNIHKVASIYMDYQMSNTKMTLCHNYRKTQSAMGHKSTTNQTSMVDLKDYYYFFPLKDKCSGKGGSLLASHLLVCIKMHKPPQGQKCRLCSDRGRAEHCLQAEAS